MPCSDGRERERIVYVKNGTELRKQVEEARKLHGVNSHLEAALCAVLTELEHMGIAEKVIAKSSKRGLIDLRRWWGGHKEKDKERLSRELNTYSEHEQQVIFELLEENIKAKLNKDI